MAGRTWLVQAFLLEAIARDALGDPAAAGRALERALDLAEPDGALLWFLLHPAPGLLERHARHAHRARRPDRRDPQPAGRDASPRRRPAEPRPPLEPLSDSEIRVLRYLPTNLSAPEIASELYVSTNTVRTHMRHLYAKLGAHRRAEAVDARPRPRPARTLRTPALTRPGPQASAKTTGTPPAGDDGHPRHAGRARPGVGVLAGLGLAGSLPFTCQPRAQQGERVSTG